MSGENRSEHGPSKDPLPEALYFPSEGLDYGRVLHEMLEDALSAGNIEAARRVAAELRQRDRQQREVGGLNPVSGLPDKGTFFEKLKLCDDVLTMHEDLFRRDTDTREMPIGYQILAFDLTRFKEVNDNYSHTMGDRMLAAFGAALKNSVRETDLISHLSGDEFAVGLGLGRGHDPEATMRLVVDRLRERIYDMQEKNPDGTWKFAPFAGWDEQDAEVFATLGFRYGYTTTDREAHPHNPASAAFVKADEHLKRVRDEEGGLR